MQNISPFLMFNDQAEQAANLYVSLFPNSRIVSVSRYGDGGPQPAGTAMSVTFEIDGLTVQAFNGGPSFHFTEGLSLFVQASDQEQLDSYWNSLMADGGGPGQCGWLRDRFGLSWQIVPTVLQSLLSDPDPVKAGRAMQAMLGMSKLDIAQLQAAHDGIELDTL